MNDRLLRMALSAAFAATLGFATLGCDEGGSSEPSAKAVPAASKAGHGAAGLGVSGGADRMKTLSGKVLETMDASSYTYVKLAGPDGEVWAAGPKTTVAVGDTVTVRDAMTMKGFESKTLGRKFDEILFAGALDTGKAGAAATAAGAPHGAMGKGMGAPHGAMGKGMASPHGAMGKGMGAPHGAMGKGMGAPHAGDGAALSARVKAAKTDVPEVTKAAGEGGRTVAEVWGQSAALNGKKVSVRGVVVRSSPKIMGRNWLHIQDRSGDPQKGTHDLTVTSDVTAAVGDIVLVEGTLATDKDFGAGYRYAVILEKATITVEPK